jgi:flagellar biosynthetic protein FlhB
MAAGDEEKTLPATPRRISQARKRGQVAKSQDLVAGVLLLAAVVFLGAFGGEMVQRMLGMIRYCLSEDVGSAQETGQIGLLMALCGETATWVTVPVMIVLVVAALVVNYVEIGYLVTLEPLKPNLSKIDPINGFKRLFSISSVVRLGLNLLKLAAVALVAYVTVMSMLPQVTWASSMSVPEAVTFIGRVIFKLALRLGLVLLVIGVLDYAWNRHKWSKDLRMTRQEMKEEHKMLDGDPQIKRRRRQAQIALAIQRIRGGVPKADVVVTNPTEIAVAIRYDAEKMNAPIVVAKGQGYLAEMIRRLALKHDVPIVERKPLARVLYKLVDVGQEVPPQLYQAVAEVLAYVYNLTGRRRQALRRGA